MMNLKWIRYSIAAVILLAVIAFVAAKIVLPGLKHTSDRINVIVMPENPMVDDVLSIKITGFEPYQQVTLRARMKDDSGKWWRSEAEVKADEDGVIDLKKQAPVSGTYSGLEPMGLIWSMRPEDQKEGTAYSNQKIAREDLSLEVEVNGVITAEKKIPRYYMAPGVTRVPVDEDGLVGVLFKPAKTTAAPGIIVLGGSDGGIREDYSALLASRGFVAFSLAYFGRSGVPRELSGIRLEYLEKAMRWLEGNPSVSKNGLGIIGRSKGGELALLGASYYPDFKAAVGVVPSSVVWQSPSAIEKYKNTSSWDYKGEELPYLHVKPSFFFITGAMWAKMTGGPILTSSLYSGALKDKAAVVDAMIPVEKINGPVLLVSARDDKVWPSGKMCKMAMDRLRRAGRTNDAELFYDNAGHMISVPYLPTTISAARNKSAGGKIEYGGSPKGNADASADSWPKIVKFFEDNLH